MWLERLLPGIEDDLLMKRLNFHQPRATEKKYGRFHALFGVET
jgi:hypothetical protein